MSEKTTGTETAATSWKRIKNADRYCFACGTDNPHGLHMTFESDGAHVRSQLELEKRYCGWSNLAHGGILATILDETMSWTTLSLTGKLMLTKGMQVKYLRPIRVGTKITVTGYIRKWLSEKKVDVVAEIRDETGKICARSSGEFPLFTREQFLRMGIMEEAEIDAMLAIIS